MDRASASMQPMSTHTTGTGNSGRADRANSVMPPVRGSLPYTKQEYAGLHPSKKTPALNFLILGKLPSLEIHSYPPMQLPQEVNAVAQKCIELGEWGALQFLWDQSGIDPNKATLSIGGRELSHAAVKNMADACSAYPGMQLQVGFEDVEPDAEKTLSRLIADGKVRELSAGDSYAPNEISCDFLAPVLGKVGESLVLANISFSEASEMAFAESLANAPSLKCLSLSGVSFAEGQGAAFVEGMTHNQSITKMYVQFTSLPFGSPQSGYTLMLSKNNVLESLEIFHRQHSDADVTLELDAVFSGIKTNNTLRELKFMCNADPAETLTEISNLQYVLENNSHLRTLDLEIRLASPEAYRSVAESLKKNITLTQLSLLGLENQDPDVIQSINATLTRNRGIVNLEQMRIAGMAFDPSNTTGLSDAGSVIARIILENSSTPDEFAETMAAVELSIKELEKQKAMPSTGSENEGITLTTATSTTNTTTTTITATTTNGTPPPNLPSS